MHLSDGLSLAMTAVTAWMAWETRRMAKVASDSLKASREPQLCLHTVDLHQGPIAGPYPTAGSLGAQITVQLKNPGQVRINYDVEQADLVLDGNPGSRGPYDNHAGVIFPGDTNQFRLPPVLLKSPLASGATGTLAFRVRYWSHPNERYSLEFTIGFIASNMKWVYQRGPTYA